MADVGAAPLALADGGLPMMWFMAGLSVGIPTGVFLMWRYVRSSPFRLW